MTEKKKKPLYRRILHPFKMAYLNFRWVARRFGYFLYELILLSRPIQKNKIVFINFIGRGYGDNPKYIADSLLKSENKYDMVWLVNQDGMPFPEGIRTVKFDSFAAVKELSTAAVIITNVKCYIDCIKRKNKQYVIQTWHGSFSPKRIELDAIDKLPRSYIRESKSNSRKTDLFLSASSLQSEEYRKFFWCKCDILEKGFPRNDCFFHLTKEDVERTRKEVGIKPGTKVLFYCPTFRGDGSDNQGYGFDAKKAVQTLEKKTGQKWVALIRFHPNLASIAIDGLTFDEQIINVTSYPDGQGLIGAADYIVTDYSSTPYDAMNLKRPTFIFASDIEAYQKLRGVKDFFFTSPFPLARNNEEMEKNLLEFDEEAYEKKIDQFLKDNLFFDDGHATEAITQVIEEWLEKTYAPLPKKEAK